VSSSNRVILQYGIAVHTSRTHVTCDEDEDDDKDDDEDEDETPYHTVTYCVRGAARSSHPPNVVNT
jgi:hypothetical protein